jgi:perosamine synthetase
MKVPVSRPLIANSDIESVISALRNGMISGDTILIREFEKKLASFVNSSYCIAVSSGTTALDLAFDCLDIKPGDTWIVPAFTITSTVNGLLRRGARLLIVDSELDSWSMDTSLLHNLDLNNISGAVITHIFGLAGDIGGLKKILGGEVPIIEDAAESLGAKYKSSLCGSLGLAGIFSFYSNKVITSGEGGAIVTNDGAFADKLKYYRNLCFGTERFVHDDLGWNYRMPSVSAALLLSQLERIESIIQYKVEIANRYKNALRDIDGLDFMSNQNKYSSNTYWVFPILINGKSKISRAQLQKTLAEHGVETRRLFFPIHLQPYLKRYSHSLVGSMPVAESLWNSGMYLPSGAGITLEEVDYVIEIIQNIYT